MVFDTYLDIYFLICKEYLASLKLDYKSLWSKIRDNIIPYVLIMKSFNTSVLSCCYSFEQFVYKSNLIFISMLIEVYVLC